MCLELKPWKHFSRSDLYNFWKTSKKVSFKKQTLQKRYTWYKQERFGDLCLEVGSSVRQKQNTIDNIEHTE